MAMKQRERTMALGLGLTVGFIVLYWGFSQYRSMFSAREGTLTSLRKTVAGKETKLVLVHKAIARRRELEKRSLPTNRTAAENRYQDWLVGLVSGKLTELSVGPKPVVGRPKGYEALGFLVKGQGSLQQIVRVLYDFYSANHLHQITLLNIKPQEKTGALDLTMHVEAIILPGADRTDKLTDVPGDNLALEKYEEYEKGIAGRNLFAEYKAPPPAVARVERPPEPTFDLARLAFVTSFVVGRDGRPQAWIHERNVNKTTRLFEGDEFQVAGVKGTIKRINIDNRSVEIEVDGTPITVSPNKSIGESLAERQKANK